MAHYAVIANNLVVQVIVGRNENEEGIDWETHYSNYFGKKVLRTSYNTRNGIYYDSETGYPADDQSKAFRGNYAGIGFTYDEQLDAFLPPKPYDSWVINTSTYSWEAPIQYPDDEQSYRWDESSQSWVFDS
jgi:hypothetical protein